MNGDDVSETFQAKINKNIHGKEVFFRVARKFSVTQETSMAFCVVTDSSPVCDTSRVKNVPFRFLHQHHVVAYLSMMEHSQKFSRQITDTLDASVRNNEDWHPSDAANAFLALEKYALNLLDYPWKTEFKTLKVGSASSL